VNETGCPPLVTWTPRCTVDSLIASLKTSEMTEFVGSPASPLAGWLAIRVGPCISCPKDVVNELLKYEYPEIFPKISRMLYESCET